MVESDSDSGSGSDSDTTCDNIKRSRTLSNSDSEGDDDRKRSDHGQSDHCRGRDRERREHNGPPPWPPYCSASFVLILEKESVLQNLASTVYNGENVSGGTNNSSSNASGSGASAYPSCVLLTGCGFPSLAVRALAVALATQLKGSEASDPSSSKRDNIMTDVVIDTSAVPGRSTDGHLPELQQQSNGVPALVLTDYNPYGAAIAALYFTGAGTGTRAAAVASAVMQQAASVTTASATMLSQATSARKRIQSTNSTISHSDNNKTLSSTSRVSSNTTASDLSASVSKCELKGQWALGLRGRMRWIGVRANDIALAEQAMRTTANSTTSSTSLTAIAMDAGVHKNNESMHTARANAAGPLTASQSLPSGSQPLSLTLLSSQSQTPCALNARLLESITSCVTVARSLRPNFKSSRLWTGTVAQPLTARDKALALGLINKHQKRAQRGEKLMLGKQSQNARLIKLIKNATSKNVPRGAAQSTRTNRAEERVEVAHKPTKKGNSKATTKHNMNDNDDDNNSLNGSDNADDEDSSDNTDNEDNEDDDDLNTATDSDTMAAEVEADLFAFELVEELKGMLLVGRKIEIQTLYEAEPLFVMNKVILPKLHL